VEGFKGKFVKGSEPESVYWKRRAIVAGAVLLLVLAVVLGLSALGGGEEEPEAKADAAQGEWQPPSASSTVNKPYIRETPAAEPSASPSPTVAPVEACAPEDLMLQVVAAFGEARSGAEVPVSVLVASGAETACTVDLREVAVELAAGEDVVYSTAHCETPKGEQVELSGGAGQTVELTGDGLASEAACEGARRVLPAGDYELRARLGDAVSAPTGLRLT
jgi:hypothetical protein